MSSINKRKEKAVTSEEAPDKKTKLSRQARARKNKKQRREQEQQIETHHEPDNINIVFDPNRVHISI